MIYDKNKSDNPNSMYFALGSFQGRQDSFDFHVFLRLWGALEGYLLGGEAVADELLPRRLVEGNGRCAGTATLAGG